MFQSSSRNANLSIIFISLYFSSAKPFKELWYLVSWTTVEFYWLFFTYLFQMCIPFFISFGKKLRMWGSLFALNAAQHLLILLFKFASLIQLLTINTVINICLSFQISVIVAEGSSEPPERLSNNMTQLDKDSLEKRGKIETVYHRAGVALGVNFSKAFAATSAQIQDIHRVLNQNPGSELQEKVEIRGSFIEPSFWMFLNQIPQFGKTWRDSKRQSFAWTCSRVYLSTVFQIRSVMVCTRTFYTANTEHQAR